MLLISCANVVSPTGGEKDVSPPKVEEIAFLNSERGEGANTIVFKFNEHVQLNNWQEYFYISPPTRASIEKKITGKTLYITIEDSLEKNSAYFVVLNSCLKDNNEGNILDSLSYLFNTGENSDTLFIRGVLKDSYTLNPLNNAWVMLFDENTNDSLILKKPANYLAKTNKKGFFYFPNLKNKHYKIAALSGFDSNYLKGEDVAFLKNPISAKNDSFISLFSFNPQNDLEPFDSILKQTNKNQSNKDSYILDSASKTLNQNTGSLKIVTQENTACIFQLIQNEKLILNVSFLEEPYLINNIKAGKYSLKKIIDTNMDGFWNTGCWESRLQPEKTINYPHEIIIRSNWDLELDWTTE